MGIQIFINSVEETVAVRQITYKEMWLKVRETADKLFVAMQQATLDKDAAVEALRSADQNITETQQALWAAQKECAGLRGELQAAQSQAARLQARNELLWNTYSDLVYTQNRTEATQKPTGDVVASTSATLHAALNLDGIAQAGKANNDCANPTDSRIDDLLVELSATANRYGGHYGLPMLYSTGKQEMVNIVKRWVSGK